MTTTPAQASGETVAAAAPKTIRSVVRALSVLEAIGGDAKGISGISKELGLSKGTVFDLVKTLEHMRYLMQERQGEKYRLGPAFMKLAMNRISTLDIIEIARPYLQALSDEVGEIAHLARREGTSALYLLRTAPAKSRRMLHLFSHVGALSPMHCTSAGKIFMAYMSEDEAQRFLQEDLPAFTSKTLCKPDLLQKERRDVRERGYSLNLGEFEEGVSSIAVPVRDSHGDVIAAINFALPSVRMPEPRIMDFFGRLRQAADLISAELGG